MLGRLPTPKVEHCDKYSADRQCRSAGWSVSVSEVHLPVCQFLAGAFAHNYNLFLSNRQSVIRHIFLWSNKKARSGCAVQYAAESGETVHAEIHQIRRVIRSLQKSCRLYISIVLEPGKDAYTHWQESNSWSAVVYNTLRIHRWLRDAFHLVIL